MVNAEINNKQIMNERINALTKENNELRKLKNNITKKNDPLFNLAQNEKKTIAQKMKEQKNNVLASEEIKYEPLFK